MTDYFRRDDAKTKTKKEEKKREEKVGMLVM